MPDKGAPSSADRVNRQFLAPRSNLLWVSDFTYVATWQGFVYVAFVIDTFARRKAVSSRSAIMRPGKARSPSIIAA